MNKDQYQWKHLQTQLQYSTDYQAMQESKAETDLISLVNDVKHTIKTRNVSALPGAFELLEKCLSVHYKNREKKAHAVNSDFSSHELNHQFELVGLVFLRDSLVAKNGAWSDDEAKLDLQFLTDLLLEHITNEEYAGIPNSICGVDQEGRANHHMGIP